MKISIISAMARNRVIGRDNDLPWDLPEEFAYFMRTTLGRPCVMGRRTFESTDEPLPDRELIVLTRRPDYRPAGATCFPSLQAALADLEARCGPDEEIFLIGGEAVYREGLAVADRLYLTVIDRDFDGDARFPEFDPADWTLVWTRDAARGDLRYQMRRYERRRTSSRPNSVPNTAHFDETRPEAQPPSQPESQPPSSSQPADS